MFNIQFKLRHLNILLFSLSITMGSIVSVYGQNSKKLLPLKLKVGTYNVGHFNQGNLGGFQMTGNKAKAELNNWRVWIGQQNLDILGLNEWNKFFDKDSTYNAQQELLDPFYANVYFGKENKWIYNGIATNFKLHNLHQVNWQGEYYALVGELTIGDKTIHIISTHIPWQKKWHDKAMTDLIALLSQYEYFICLGDINAFDESQKLFLKAGFNMANGGYLGWFPTASGRVASSGYKGKKNDNIDNIVTSSNIKIMNVSAPKTGLNDLDHRPIIANVIVTW